jgi:zinc/manganese transport system permease protein
VAGLSIVFAVVAADGGLLASFQTNVKASVFITSVSFATYVVARLTGPLLRDRRRSRHHGHPPRQEATPPRPTAELPGTPVAAASPGDGDGSGNPAIRPRASGR